MSSGWWGRGPSLELAPGADLPGEPTLPARPSLPPALWALEFVLGAENAALVARGVAWWWLALSCGAALACGVYALRADAAPDDSADKASLAWVAAACFAAVAIALAASTLFLAHGAAFTRAMGSSSVSTWRFEALTDSTEASYGLRCQARATRAGKPSGDVWLRTSSPLSRGETLVCVGRYTPAAEDDWGTASVAQGVWGSVTVVRELSRGQREGPLTWPLRLRNSFLEVIEPERSEERALLAGCVLGDRSALAARGLDELFSACGVAHLVAVSGAHIALVAGVVEGIAQRFRLHPRVRLAATLGVSGAFVLVCGAPPSAVRAWVMSSSAALATMVGRRVDPLSAVVLVGIGTALVDPGLSGQLGFLLSIVCVAALTVFAPYARYALVATLPCPRLPRWTGQRMHGAWRATWASASAGVAASLVCQVASAPLTLPAFSRLALVGPVAAVVLGTPFSVLMCCGVAAVCLGGLAQGLASAQGGLLWILTTTLRVVLEAGGNAALAAAELSASLVIACLRILTHLPFASVSVQVEGAILGTAVVLLALGLYLAWPRVRGEYVRRVAAALACIVLVFFLRWRYFAPARVCVLDIGQGDAILVQEGGAAVLVDTGPDVSIAAALAREHVVHLDVVVLTHLHDDHTGGLSALVGTVPCERVYVAEGVTAHVGIELSEEVRELTGGACEELRLGDVLHVGSFELKMVWPWEPVDGSVNAHSIELVVRYEHGGRHLTALLTGDAERDETGAVLAAELVGQIDLLKVGHHGSEVSITPEQAVALAPLVAVASAGEDNAYGHPRPECVETLEAAGALFLCTKDVGDVEVRPGTRGPVVRTRR